MDLLIAEPMPLEREPAQDEEDRIVPHEHHTVFSSEQLQHNHPKLPYPEARVRQAGDPRDGSDG